MQDSHWGAERPASEPEQEAEFEGLVGFCQVKGREEKDIPGRGNSTCEGLMGERSWQVLVLERRSVGLKVGWTVG